MSLKTRYQSCAAVVVAMLLSIGAQCDEYSTRWKCNASEIECLGKVQLTIRKAFWEEAVGEYVLSQFTNDEFLFEDYSRGQVKKLLHLVKGNTYAYFGTESEAESDALRGRYQQEVGQTIFFVVLASLIGAFPEGVDEIPVDWQTRSLLNEGKTFDVSARKSGKNKFLFKVKERLQRNPQAWDVEGEWEVSKPVSWPDQTSMDGWTIQGKPSPSLKELRKWAN